MKISLYKLLFAVSLFVTANIAHAGLFGFSTTVQATDGANFYSQNISSGTFSACELQRQSVVSAWLSLGYFITSNPICSPVAIDPNLDLDKFRVIDWIDGIDWPRPWPWPVCLSCPYLISDVIDHIYPVRADKVKQLMEGYGIDQYNQELQKLQERYDLQGFENEMHNLELQMGLENLKR